VSHFVGTGAVAHRQGRSFLQFPVFGPPTGLPSGTDPLTSSPSLCLIWTRLTMSDKPVKSETKTSKTDSKTASTQTDSKKLDSVRVVAEATVDANADDCWKIVGQWEPTFLNSAIVASSDGKTRTITVGSFDGEVDLTTVETLVERSDKDRFYSFSQAPGSDMMFLPFTDALTKMSVVPSGDNKSKIILDTTVVPLTDPDECFFQVQSGLDQTIAQYAEQVALRCKKPAAAEAKKD